MSTATDSSRGALSVGLGSDIIEGDWQEAHELQNYAIQEATVQYLAIDCTDLGIFFRNDAGGSIRFNLDLLIDADAPRLTCDARALVPTGGTYEVEFDFGGGDTATAALSAGTPAATDTVSPASPGWNTCTITLTQTAGTNADTQLLFLRVQGGRVTAPVGPQA